MKKVLLIAIAAMLIGVAASAQIAQPIPTPDIPLPQDAVLLTEINLSENDLLGMAKDALAAFAASSRGAKGEVGQIIAAADLDTLLSIIKDVKAVRAMQFQIPKNCTADDLLEFYQSALTTEQGWSRIIYDKSTMPKGAAAVYTRGGEEYFAVGIEPAKQRAYAMRSVGAVDVVKMGGWLGGVMKRFSELKTTLGAQPTKTTKPSSTTTTKPTQKPTQTKSKPTTISK